MVAKHAAPKRGTTIPGAAAVASQPGAAGNPVLACPGWLRRPAARLAGSWHTIRRAWRAQKELPPWRRARHRIQRARRGWSDRDAVTLHVYLAQVIAGTTGRLAGTTWSTPMGMTLQDWMGVLHTISAAFTAYTSPGREGADGWEEQLADAIAARDQVQGALKLLAEHYGDLWS